MSMPSAGFDVAAKRELEAIDVEKTFRAINDSISLVDAAAKILFGFELSLKDNITEEFKQQMFGAVYEDIKKLESNDSDLNRLFSETEEKIGKMEATFDKYLNGLVASMYNDLIKERQRPAEMTAEEKKKYKKILREYKRKWGGDNIFKSAVKKLTQTIRERLDEANRPDFKAKLKELEVAQVEIKKEITKVLEFCRGKRQELLGGGKTLEERLKERLKQVQGDLKKLKADLVNYKVSWKNIFKALIDLSIYGPQRKKRIKQVDLLIEDAAKTLPDQYGDAKTKVKLLELQVEQELERGAPGMH